MLENGEVQKRLKGLADRKGWASMRAVKDKRFHSIYHQFYNSPYHFVALQAFAKWFHPDEFEDLDPQATFEELHNRFPADRQRRHFWATLQ